MTDLKRKTTISFPKSILPTHFAPYTYVQMYACGFPINIKLTHFNNHLKVSVRAQYQKTNNKKIPEYQHRSTLLTPPQLFTHETYGACGVHGDYAFQWVCHKTHSQLLLAAPLRFDSRKLWVVHSYQIMALYITRSLLSSKLSVEMILKVRLSGEIIAVITSSGNSSELQRRAPLACLSTSTYIRMYVLVCVRRDSGG